MASSLTSCRRQKVDVPEHSLGQFPVNEATWGMFMNTFMWAAVRLDKDADQSQRVLRNMDVESIQKLSPQRAIRSRVFKNENCYVYKTNWVAPKAHRSRVLRLIKGISNNYRQTCLSSRTVLRLGGKCRLHPRSREIWEHEKRSYFVTS